MWAKFRFTGTFICFAISDNFLVFTRKQPHIEVHKWAKPSKMWVSPLWHINKKSHPSIVYMDNWANPHILLFFKEMLNFKVSIKNGN